MKRFFDLNALSDEACSPISRIVCETGTPYLVPSEDNFFFEGWQNGAKIKNQFKVISGADSKHMFRPD